MDRENCDMSKNSAFFGLPPYRMASLNPQYTPHTGSVYPLFWAPFFTHLPRIPGGICLGRIPGGIFLGCIPGGIFLKVRTPTTRALPYTYVFGHRTSQSFPILPVSLMAGRPGEAKQAQNFLVNPNRSKTP